MSEALAPAYVSEFESGGPLRRASDCCEPETRSSGWDGAFLALPRFVTFILKQTLQTSIDLSQI